MKYLPLIWAGLWRKRLRTVFTFLSIVAAFVLFGVLQGVDAGLAHVRDLQRLDRLFAGSRFGTPLPISIGTQIEAVPGVTKAVVSYKNKTAVVTYDDTKADVKALTTATTNAGYPSAPKS